MDEKEGNLIFSRALNETFDRFVNRKSACMDTGLLIRFHGNRIFPVYILYREEGGMIG